MPLSTCPQRKPCVKCFSLFLSLSLSPPLSVCLSVSPSISLLVRLSFQVEKWKNKGSRCLCVGVEVGVWMGVGCLCPPVRNNIVTLCYIGERERQREKEGERENENGREKEREKETGKQRTNRETHVESGTNRKDAQRKKKSTRQYTITRNSKTLHLRLFSYGERRLYCIKK